MSDKETNRNENPWRARGFKKPFNGTKYQEFVDANKSNALIEAEPPSARASSGQVRNEK